MNKSFHRFSIQNAWEMGTSDSACEWDEISKQNMAPQHDCKTLLILKWLRKVNCTLSYRRMPKWHSVNKMHELITPFSPYLECLCSILGDLVISPAFSCFGCPARCILPQQFSSVQLLSHVRLFVTPWIAARQVSLSITNSWSSLRLTSTESMMPSSHLILCRPLEWRCTYKEWTSGPSRGRTGWDEWRK